jgi:hypothetical protein
MKSILILDDKSRNNLKDLKDYAEENPIDLERMKKIVALESPPIGDDEAHVVHLPLSIRVVYSLEQHINALCKHLSVSSVRQEEPPGPDLVQMIANELDFGDIRKESVAYFEDFGTGKAVNIIKKYRMQK